MTTTETQPAIDPQRARAVVTERIIETYAAARAFADGDHYQGGAGWIGAHLTGSDAAAVAAFQAIIATHFVSSNVVGEGVSRHRAAVVGREPAWRYTPTRALAEDEEPAGAEQALIDEAEALMTAWWNRVDAAGRTGEATDAALLGRRGCLRLYVPAGALTEDGALDVPPGDLAAALTRLQLEALPPDRATVARDARTGQDVAVVLVPEVAGIFEEQPQGEGDIEVVRLVEMPDGLWTEIVTLTKAGEAAGDPLPLGGRLTVAQVERAPLITPQVMQLQKALNHSLTMMERNQDQAGSVERWITGSMHPALEYNADTRAWEDSGAALAIGPSTTNFLGGIPIYGDPNNPDAITGYTTPAVSRIDPVSPETFTATQAALYARMLGEMDQIHALISGDATASGESRIQARAQFLASLRPTAAAVEGALRAILDAALAWAAAAVGQGGRFALIRADVTCQIDAGPLTSDERRLILEQQAAGLLSEETAMGLLGVDDVDSERAKINTERDARQARAPMTGQTQPLVAMPGQEPAEDGEEVTR
jgi:hypothetical protein